MLHFNTQLVLLVPFLASPFFSTFVFPISLVSYCSILQVSHLFILNIQEKSSCCCLTITKCRLISSCTRIWCANWQSLIPIFFICRRAANYKAHVRNFIFVNILVSYSRRAEAHTSSAISHSIVASFETHLRNQMNILFIAISIRRRKTFSSSCSTARCCLSGYGKVLTTTVFYTLLSDFYFLIRIIIFLRWSAASSMI